MEIDDSAPRTGLPEPPSFTVNTSSEEGRRICRFIDVNWILTRMDSLDWKEDMTLTDNLATLDIIYGDAADAPRGELERILECAMTREDEKRLLENDLYADLVDWAKTADHKPASIVNTILSSNLALRASRILDAFTEFACEGHDKIHRKFLTMNTERVDHFLENRPTVEFTNAILKKLTEDLITKFRNSYKPSKGISVSQELSRNAIDGLSFVAQMVFRDDSAMEIAPASFLCDIPRPSKEKAPTDGGGDAAFDNNIIPQVTRAIQDRSYVVPDACNPKKEQILKDLIMVFFFGALADAADTTIPDSTVRCLFLALQTFFDIGEYQSFFGVDMEPSHPHVHVPFTFTAGFECGEFGPDREYTPILTYMQETSGGEFKYALCTCFKWSGIKKLVKTNYEAKIKKQVLAPIIFIYHRYTGDDKNGFKKKLEKCSEQFLSRVKTTVLNPKISRLSSLMQNPEIIRQLGNNIITPTPLPHFTDEDGSFMFLVAAWNTEGPSLANNATLLLALSGMPDLDVKKIIAGSIRGEQDFDSCNTLLDNVDLLIIGNADIPSNMKGGGRFAKNKKLLAEQKAVETQRQRAAAAAEVRTQGLKTQTAMVMMSGTRQQQREHQLLLKEQTDAEKINKHPVETTRKKPEALSSNPEASASSKHNKGVVKPQLVTTTRKDDVDELRTMFIRIRRYGGLDWKEVMDRLKGRAAILVYLLTGFMAILFTVDVCLAKSLCHIIFCIVRHADVLSCYGELTTILDSTQKERINILKAKLVNYGMHLPDTGKSETQMEHPANSSVLEYERKDYLERLHKYLFDKMGPLQEGMFRQWENGIKMCTVPGKFSGIPSEYVLFNFLYLISASAIIESDLFCNRDAFVNAFSVVDSHTSSTHMLVRQYLRVNPDAMEKIHVLVDNRQENWIKSFEDPVVHEFDEHSTLLNLIWKKASCGGIKMDSLPLLISELSLGELCYEHWNLRKMPPSWRGISLNRKLAPTLKNAAEQSLLLNKYSLEQCFLPVFCNSISVFIQKNCSAIDGSIRNNTRIYLKWFLHSEKMRALPELRQTIEELSKGKTSNQSLLESRYLSKPLGEYLLKRIAEQDDAISKERKLDEIKTALLVQGVAGTPTKKIGAKGGSRKKNKHNTTKKYKTKSRKSRQTRRNKHKHNHARTIKRRKSQRNNSN